MNDIYSLGCLLYEFLNGLPPHYNADRDTMFTNIVTKPLMIPSHLSPEAKDLIRKLLAKNQRNRIGWADGITEIKNHPFCRSMDFEALSERKIKPPFIPNLDESYFDTDYLTKHLAENPENYFNLPLDGSYFPSAVS
jgi:serine/threonine protein kinase